MGPGPFFVDMPTYCYRCLDCGKGLTGTDRRLNDGAVHCETPIVRDYRAENVGFSGIDIIKREREGKLADRDAILPTARDFQRPEDPTGEKGMQRWMETHEPKPENKRPAWPTRSERRGT